MPLDYLDALPLVEKTRKTRDHYSEELSDIIRYNHFSTIVPQRIQPIIKNYLPNRHEILAGDLISEDTKIKLLEQYEDIEKGKITALFMDDNHEDIVIGFEKVKDGSWNTLDMPFWEISYDNNKYRSVPGNGDCLHHMHTQSDSFRKEFLPYLPSGVSEETIGDQYIYQEIHDLDEMIEGDEYAYSKQADLQSEAKTLELLLRHEGHDYTNDEIYYLQRVLKENEGKHTLFGVGEMLEYLKDGINCIKGDNGKYFNRDRGLGPNIWMSTGSKFQDPNKKAEFTENGKKKEVLYAEIPAIGAFLSRYSDNINTMLDRMRNDTAHLISLNTKFLTTQEKIDELERMIDGLRNAYA